MISVVIPVYNTEKYLHKCVDSILNQTYKNIEVILVDDGSIDKSLSICNEYVNKDNRVSVIHTENKGVSAARNIGIRVAKGEYIAFVDSDDAINPFMLEILHDNAVSNNADIAVCHYQNVFEENDICNYYTESANDNGIKCNEKLKIYSGLEMCYELYGNDFVNTCIVWNKLFKKTLFDDILFPVGVTHEDEAIIYKLFLKSEKIVCSKKRLYYYLIRNDGITGSERTGKYISEDFTEVIYERYLYMKNNCFNELALLSFQKYMGLCIKRYYFSTSKIVINKYTRKYIHKQYKKRYVTEKKYLSKCNKDTIDPRCKISIYKRIYYNVFCRCPRILGVVYRMISN